MEHVATAILILICSSVAAAWVAVATWGAS